VLAVGDKGEADIFSEMLERLQSERPDDAEFLVWGIVASGAPHFVVLRRHAEQWWIQDPLEPAAHVISYSRRPSLVGKSLSAYVLRSLPLPLPPPPPYSAHVVTPPGRHRACAAPSHAPGQRLHRALLTACAVVDCLLPTALPFKGAPRGPPSHSSRGEQRSRRSSGSTGEL
jgi:hypothetical protein